MIKWIPVTEELPKENERVLICQEVYNQYSFNYYVRIAKIEENRWVDDSIYSEEIDSDTEFDKIVFWSDLPKFKQDFVVVDDLKKEDRK